MPFADNQGIRIHYHVDGTGPALVLHHGFAGSLHDWSDFEYVGALRDDCLLIMLDARGHGESDKPHEAEAYGARCVASDVVAVLDALGVEKAHFWGYSGGGCVGWTINRFFPERLRSLVSGAGPLEDWDQEPEHPDPHFRHYYERMVTFLREGREAWAARWERWMGAWWRPEMRERCLSADLEAYIALQVQAFRERAGLREAARTMDLPCLVYAGEDDEWYPHSKRTAELARGAVFVSVPGLAHLESLYRSDLVLPHVRGFLASVEA